MDNFFKGGDNLEKLLQNLKKNKNLSRETRIRKAEEIREILSSLKNTIVQTKVKTLREDLKRRYLHLKGIARQCLNLLDTNKADIPSDLDKTLDTGEAPEEEEIKTEEEEEEEDPENTDFESASENEDQTTAMAKLDLGIAFKIVKPFDGAAENLLSHIESVELLEEYSEGVPQDKILKFWRTTLIGTAHGAIDEAATIAQAKTALKEKFAVKLTPKAVENEMLSKRQHSKSISDFGSEIEKLAAKLAAAHVSQGTFATEAAASKIVNKSAVDAFVEGLQNPTTKFMLQVRNPETLSKAISDALECSTSAKPNKSEAMWCNHQHTNYQRNSYNWRGRGNPRGRGPARGNSNYNSYRGRGNYNNYNNNNNYNNYNQNRNNNYGNFRGNGRGRGRGSSHTANVAEEQPMRQQQQQQQQPQQRQNREREEANLIDLFR